MIEFLALITSLMYALSNIAVRKGLVFGSNSTTAAMVSLVVTFVVFLILLLAYFPIQQWNIQSLPYFLMAGILAPGLFRFFLYAAISRIGVAVTSIATTCFPLVASLISVAFLGENLTTFKVLGMMLTMGAAFIATSRSEGQKFDAGVLLNRGFILGVAAAVVRGGSEVLRKAGLLVFDSPIYGAAMGNAGGFLFSIALVATSPSIRSSLVYERKSFLYFVLSTLFVVAAWIFGFYALSQGEVVRVAPIVGTVPIFTVLLSPLLLKGLEQITPKIILASILAALGVASIRFGS